ncbi:hypothetical protein [Thermodesulfovibrio yellowstonii]|uniref:hypothetical protein n=1 Tax=Thermodesulfovibrio yellowstonii TaxID=28262 RepID=UPI0004193EBA|nr:hypothetical protein [Thermodesulfovibrio islandicus]
MYVSFFVPMHRVFEIGVENFLKKVKEAGYKFKVGNMGIQLLSDVFPYEDLRFAKLELQMDVNRLLSL